MHSWFRFYNSVPDDPKIGQLSDIQFRGWVNLLCIASRNAGIIPKDFSTVSYTLRTSIESVRELIQTLTGIGLLDRTRDGYQPHNWNARQFKSDVSTERVKRFRNAQRNVSETPPETETETENRIQTQKERRISGEPQQVRSPLVLLPTVNGSEFGVTEEMVSEFSKAYPAVDVEQALNEMRVWSISNPKQRKTERGMARFINSWLSKAQNRSGLNGHGKANGSSHTRFADAAREFIDEVYEGKR